MREFERMVRGREYRDQGEIPGLKIETWGTRFFFAYGRLKV